jgi:hypothetical protein
MGLGALVLRLNKQWELYMLQVDLLLECLLMLMLLKPVHRLSTLNLEWVAMPMMAVQLQWWIMGKQQLGQGKLLLLMRRGGTLTRLAVGSFTG